MTDEDGVSQSSGCHRRGDTAQQMLSWRLLLQLFFLLFVEHYHSLDSSFKRSHLTPRNFSSVSASPRGEGPLKPLLRMPDPSNSKSNNWCELGSRLACWHFSERQLQHSLFILQLPAHSVWSSKGSSPEKQNPAFVVPGLGSSLPFVLFPCYQKPKGHYLMFPGLVHPQLGLHSVKLYSSCSFFFRLYFEL